MLQIARALAEELKRTNLAAEVPILVVQLEIFEKGSESPIKWHSFRSWGDRTHLVIRQWFDAEADSFGALVRGQRVLVVDAIDDTRATLEAVVEQLKTLHAPSSIGVFVLHDKIKPKVGSLSDDVQYIVAEETRDAWICYPWEAEGGSLAAHEALARRCAGHAAGADTSTAGDGGSEVPPMAWLVGVAAIGVAIGASLAVAALRRR